MLVQDKLERAKGLCGCGIDRQVQRQGPQSFQVVVKQRSLCRHTEDEQESEAGVCRHCTDRQLQQRGALACLTVAREQRGAGR